MTGDRHSELIEKLVNDRITSPPNEGIAVRWPFSTYSFRPGRVGIEDVLRKADQGPSYCKSESLFEVAASTRVPSDGVAKVRVKWYVCNADAFSSPVVLTATAQSDQPVYVTSQQAIVDDGEDIEITLRTWAQDGTPVGGISVDWRLSCVSEVNID